MIKLSDLKGVGKKFIESLNQNHIFTTLDLLLYLPRSYLDRTNLNKIDDLVHIGHNSFLGDNSQITVGAIILGRAMLGKNCWLSPGSVIDNGVEIGDNSLIGVNTHIRKNVESNSVVSGNPPRLIRKVKND